MIKTIGALLNECNKEISNELTPFVYVYDNLDARDNPIYIDSGSFIHTGVWNIDEDFPITVRGYDGDGNINNSITIDDFDVEYGTGRFYTASGYPNVSKLIFSGKKWEMNRSIQLNAWNQAVQKVNYHFANDRYVRVEAPPGYIEGTKVEVLSKDLYPLDKFSSISGIYKNETDTTSFKLTDRGDKIYVSEKVSNINNSYEYQFGQPIYTESKNNLTFPFYVRGGYLLPEVFTGYEQDKDTEFYVDNLLVVQLKLLVKYYLFEGQYYQLQKNDASNKTFFITKNINNQMFSLSNQIKIENFTSVVPKSFKIASAKSKQEYFNTFE